MPCPRSRHRPRHWQGAAPSSDRGVATTTAVAGVALGSEELYFFHSPILITPATFIFNQGVRFLYQCVTGMRLGDGFQGCIMADEMVRIWKQY